MKPALRRSRATAFAATWALAMAGNLAAAYLNFVIWSKGSGPGGDTLYRTLTADTGLNLSLALGGIALAAALVPVAHFLSYDRARARRPAFMLYGLWLSLAISGAAGALGAMRVLTLLDPPVAVAVVAALVAPLVPLWIESALGRAKIGAAHAMLKSGRHGAALGFARIGLNLRPGDVAGERTFGLALQGRGHAAEALPYLHGSYDRGDRDPGLLAALADAEETAGDTARAAALVEELHAARPDRLLFERQIRLWLASDQGDRALAALGALPDTERHGTWADTLADLMLERRDFAGLLALDSGMEPDGAPFARSRGLLERMLAAGCADEKVIVRMADLAGRAGEPAAALDALVRLETAKGAPDAELSRRIAALHDNLGQPADAFRRRAALVEAGEGTAAEKLTVLEEMFARARYADVTRLAEGDPILRTHRRAGALHALSLEETGRPEDALAAAVEVRAAGTDPELAPRLTAMEQGIRQRRDSDQLARLAARVEAAPDDLELRLDYLDKLVAARMVDRVVVDLDSLLTRDPTKRALVIETLDGMVSRHGPNFRLATYLADLRLRDGDWDGAFEIAERLAADSLHPDTVLHDWAGKVLRGQPSHAAALLSEARYHAKRREAVLSLEWLDRYRAAGGPENGATMRLEFDQAAAVPDRDRADRAADALLALDPDDAAVLSQHAETALAAGDYDAAVERLRRLLAADPDRPSLRTLIRQTEEKAKRARIDAIRSLLAPRIDSGMAPAAADRDLMEELGDLLHDLGNMNEAIVEYQRAARGDENRDIARAKLGYVLVRKDMSDEADDAFAEARLLDGTGAGDGLGGAAAGARLEQIKGLFFAAAEILEKNGHEARSLKLLKRVFAVDAGFRDVVPRIERLNKLLTRQRRKAGI